MTRTEGTTPRARQIQWLKRLRCIQCRVKRVMPGADHPDTRWSLTCLNCGKRFRIKPPEGFDE